MSFSVNGDSIAGPSGYTSTPLKEQAIDFKFAVVSDVIRRRSGLSRIKKLFCHLGLHKWSPWMKRVKMGSILYFYRCCLRCKEEEEDWLEHPYVYPHT